MLIEYTQQVTVDCNDWVELLSFLTKKDSQGDSWSSTFIPVSTAQGEVEYSVQQLVEYIGYQAVFRTPNWNIEQGCLTKFIEGFSSFYSVSNSSEQERNTFVKQISEGIYLVFHIGRYENDFDPEQDRTNEI